MDILFRLLIIYFGYLYPSMMCFMALNSTKPKFELLQKWCRYWIIMAVFTSVEGVADTFLSWVPLYSAGKLALIVYLWHPNTQGTDHIYQDYVKPFFCKHLQSMDPINGVANPLNGKLKVLCSQALLALKERVTEVIREQDLTQHLVANGSEAIRCERVMTSHPTIHRPEQLPSSRAASRGNLTSSHQPNPVQHKGLSQSLATAIANNQHASCQVEKPKVTIAEVDDCVETDFEILDAHNIPVSPKDSTRKPMCTEVETSAVMGPKTMPWFTFRWWRQQYQVSSDGSSPDGDKKAL